MRHKVQDLDKRRVLLAGVGCALILCLALYLYFGRSVNKEKRVNHAAPLVKVQQVVRQDMMRPERRTVMRRGSSPGRLPGGIWEEPKKRLIMM